MKIELARIGVHGQDGTRLTKQMLQEVVKNWPEEVPVSIGHEAKDHMPALGWAKSPEFDEDTGSLYGKVDLNDIGKELYDKGLYKKWSIGIGKEKESSEHYPHHLAFLGSVPPKIKNLKNVEQVNAGEADFLFTFGDDEDELRQQLKESNNKIKELSDEINTIKDAIKGGNNMEPDDKKKKSGGDQKVELSDEQKQKLDKIDQMEARIKKDNINRLKQAAEGKVPEKHINDLVALADTLTTEEVIEFSDADGNKTKESPFDVLVRILNAVPKPVKEGEYPFEHQFKDEEDKDISSQDLIKAV